MELKRIQRMLNPHYSDSAEFQRDDEEEKRSSREAVLKITLDFLKTMKQQELANCLRLSKRI